MNATLNAREILGLYQALVEAAELMLVSIQMEDWDRFINLTELVAGKTVALQAGDVDVPMNPKEISEKKALIEKYFAIERIVMDSAESRKTELATMINSTAMQGKIHQRYGSLRTQ